jgi:hypothetical protein
MVGLLVAAAVFAGGPGLDIRSAARRLAPAGAKIVLAQERSWDRGVVAWAAGDRTTAVPLVWRAGQWRPPSGRGVAISTSPARILSRRVYQTVHVTMRRPLLDDALWLDGRPLDAWFFPGPLRGETATISEKLRPGRHVSVAYAAINGAAVARAWTLTIH